MIKMFKNNKKLKFINLFILIIPSIFLLASCSQNVVNNENNSLTNMYEKTYKSFLNSKVTNEEFTKGADISSYAEVVEEFLWSNKIVKTNNSSVTNYRYDELETTSIKDSKTNLPITLYDYVNNNMFSYIDDIGNKQYNNLLWILKNQVGLNSVRIKIFNNPYDTNGNSYGGGHNDLDTTIWLMKEANKYGFKNINLDFHYSDFWADPGRQYVPKSWLNLDVSSIASEIKKYTYSSIKTIYEKTKIYPNVIQIGNEITKGMLWNSKKTFNIPGSHNYDETIIYLNSAIEGIKTFEKEYKLDNEIKIGLHVDDATGNLPIYALDKYFSNKFIYENVDLIYLTYYPIWQANFDFLYDYLVNHFSKWKKDIEIAEFSSPWTINKSNLSFDLTNVSAKNKIPYNISGQSMIFYEFMETISKAFPNQKTGFYYWEPAWVQVGRTSWSTHEGILYAYNTNNHDPNIVNEGNNWWNQGIFDNSFTLLSSAKIIKDYKRINNNFITIESSKNRIKNNIIDPIKNMNISYYDSYIGNKNPLKISKEFKKINISSEIIDFYNPKSINNFKINFYEEIELNNYENKIISLIKNRYTRINWDEAKIILNSFNKIDLSGELTIKANGDSFLYYGEQKILFQFKKYISNSIDLSSTTISIDKNDTNWYKPILKRIGETNIDNKNIQALIYERFKINGGISNDDNPNIWMYDPIYKQNRDVEWILLKNDLIYDEHENANFYKVNEFRYDYPKKLSDLFNKEEVDLFFGFRIKINSYQKNGDWESKSDLYKIGTEDWVNFKFMTFKLKVKLN